LELLQKHASRASGSSCLASRYASLTPPPAALPSRHASRAPANARLGFAAGRDDSQGLPGRSPADLLAFPACRLAPKSGRARLETTPQAIGTRVGSPVRDGSRAKLPRSFPFLGASLGVRPRRGLGAPPRFPARKARCSGRPGRSSDTGDGLASTRAVLCTRASIDRRVIRMATSGVNAQRACLPQPRRRRSMGSSSGRRRGCTLSVPIGCRVLHG